jgi:hypothetical protein
MDKFSYYDIIGVLAPGIVLVTGFLLLLGDLDSVTLLDGVSIGGLGLLAILGYAVGQIVQAAGNVLESVYWRLWGGKPTHWARTGRHTAIPLSERQVNQLQTVCTNLLGMDLKDGLSGVSSAEWGGITSQMRAALDSAGQAQRVSIFNSNYGFHRGLTVSLFLIGVAAFTIGSLKGGTVASAGAVITLWRMHRFARHYARELFVQVLQLPNAK